MCSLHFQMNLMQQKIYTRPHQTLFFFAAFHVVVLGTFVAYITLVGIVTLANKPGREKDRFGLYGGQSKGN
jgi:hypothetical protein